MRREAASHTNGAASTEARVVAVVVAVEAAVAVADLGQLEALVDRPP